MTKMNGLFTLRSANDLLDKLEVDFKRLCASPAGSIEAQYAAFDFFVCAEHIPDWLSSNSGGTKSSHRSYPEGAVVSHIANGAKHFRVDDPRHMSVTDTRAVQGAFQAGAFQASAFQVSRLLVELESGRDEDVLVLATRVLEHWKRKLR